ncbi:MAG TPA: lipase secretion chaperone [Spirochaetota bacterium]|nr:lipase secretion chaperone [Spirochaetota bacterium]HPQ53774.1 lipase secretion chaperone [Spirochaetota bacterium]
MDKKHIIAAVGITLIVLIGYSLLNRGGSDSLPREQIIDRNQRISSADIKKAFKRIRFSNENVPQYFSERVVNPFTIRFFKFLQRKFGNMSFEDHLRAVQEYLNSTMDARKAEEMFALYKKFSLYEKSLIDMSKTWPRPRNAQEALKYLQTIQDYRRDYFGNAIADELFGLMVKNQEYRLRKGAVLNDKSLYGKEKEKKMQEVREEMWGDDADTVDNSMRPYDRYREKLTAYSKDLSELSGEQKSAKIKEFRQAYFPPDVVTRLEQVDVQLANERQAEEQYRVQEQKIQSDPNLNQDEKEEKIKELQDTTFGDQAEAFRRRETIRKSLEERRRSR